MHGGGVEGAGWCIRGRSGRTLGTHWDTSVSDVSQAIGRYQCWIFGRWDTWDRFFASLLYSIYIFSSLFSHILYILYIYVLCVPREKRERREAGFFLGQVVGHIVFAARMCPNVSQAVAVATQRRSVEDLLIGPSPRLWRLARHQNREAQPFPTG